MNPISFASGIVPEFGPVDTIRAAAAGGFDAVGLWIETANWTASLFRETRAALADTGLPLLDVEVIWLKPDSSIDDHRRTIDIGAELGAANVLCVSSDPDHGATADRLATLCRHAEGSSMRVAIEYGVFTEVKNLATALSILDRVAHPLRALLLDPIHIDRSGGSFDALAAIDPALLPYAQICDAPAERPDPDNFDAVFIDACDLRAQCGEGGLPLDRFYRALPAGIPLSVELRSKALYDNYPDPNDRARVTAAATRRWLRELADS